MVMTEHHLYPKNGVDWYGTNHPLNRKMLPIVTHTNHHRVFGNLEFHYQILKILNLNAPIVQKKVLRQIS